MEIIFLSWNTDISPLPCLADLLGARVVRIDSVIQYPLPWIEGVSQGSVIFGSGPRTSQDLQDLEKQKLLYEQNPDPAAS